MYGLWWATEDIPEDAMHVVNKGSQELRRFDDTVLK